MRKSARQTGPLSTMQPEIRRIVAVEAHRRRTGRCPVRVHSLGTGETFDIEPAADGFVDVASGLTVRVDGEQIVVPSLQATIDLALVDDVGFDGYDHSATSRSPAAPAAAPRSRSIAAASTTSFNTPSSLRAIRSERKRAGQHDAEIFRQAHRRHRRRTRPRLRLRRTARPRRRQRHHRRDRSRRLAARPSEAERSWHRGAFRRNRYFLGSFGRSDGEGGRAKAATASMASSPMPAGPTMSAARPTTRSRPRPGIA